MKRQRIFTVFKMEMKKIIRTPLFIVFSLFFVALLVIILGLAFSNNYGWGPELSIFAQMVPGLFAYAGILIIYTVASSFTGDRDLGVERRMNTTPISSGEVMIGQILAYTIIPIIQTAIMFITALIIGWRPNFSVVGVLMFFIFMIFLSFCSVGLGLITATIAKNASTAGALAFIFIVPQQLFGSFIYMGEELRVVGYAMPSQYVTDALWRISYLTITDIQIWIDLIVIIIISFVVYFIGLILYERSKSR
ncbi:MAG: ABC transporter permease [Promethearchaeota archaeon]|nr:MAG: ABC transporter permease [Candidatus Lokiarchaeota archaeon]